MPHLTELLEELTRLLRELNRLLGDIEYIAIKRKKNDRLK